MNKPTAIRIAASLAAALALAACGKPEEPEQNEADIAKIIEAGQAKVDERSSEAVQAHMDRIADADGKPLTSGDMKQDVDNLYKVDTELAEANYKVAKEKCDTSSGATKDQCLKLAKANYEVALADALAKKAGAKAEIESLQPPR